MTIGRAGSLVPVLAVAKAASSSREVGFDVESSQLVTPLERVTPVTERAAMVMRARRENLIGPLYDR